MKRKQSIPQNPRLTIARKLLAYAEIFRKQAKVTDEADEALRWEKELRARAEEIEGEPVAKAA